MAFKVQHHSSNTTLSEINIIPLVDVMLILLVIFMVAAPSLLRDQSLLVSVPQVSTVAATQTSAQDKVVTLTPDGKIFLQTGQPGDENTAYDFKSIPDKLRALFAEVPAEQRVLFIRADKGALYGPVAQMIGIAGDLGIAQIGMITVPEEKKNP